jgi:hypothetical protein
MKTTKELKAFAQIQGLNLSTQETDQGLLLNFIGPFMGKEVVLLSYLQGKDGTFAYHSQGTCDPEMKEELPARIKSPEHLKTVLEFIAQGLYGDYPREMEFTAENWINPKIEVKQTSAMGFQIQGYDFLIGDIKIIEPFEGDVFETTEVFSLSHNKETPMYIVSRDLTPSKYSDSSFHGQDGDIERSGKSVHEVIAKLVAMCF